MRSLTSLTPPEAGSRPRPVVARMVMQEVTRVVQWPDNTVFWMTAQFCVTDDGPWWRPE